MASLFARANDLPFTETTRVSIFYRFRAIQRVKANSHRHARHDTDSRGLLFCRVWCMWWCELSRPDRQMGAFCVWSVSKCVGRRRVTKNALVRRSIHTGKTAAPASRPPLPRRRPGRHALNDSVKFIRAAQINLSIYPSTPSRQTTHMQRRCTPRKCKHAVDCCML